MTCFSVSSTVAPGHAAATTIVRMVIAGSSPRPRRRNDSVARDHRDDHQEDDQRGPLEPPLGEVRADHCLVSSRRTFWPGRSAWMPAVTTTSPGLRPGRDLDPVRIGRADLDVARRDRPGLRIDDPHGRLPVGADHRGRRDLDARAPTRASCVPVTVAPRRIAGGGLSSRTLTRNVPVTGIGARRDLADRAGGGDLRIRRQHDGDLRIRRRGVLDPRGHVERGVARRPRARPGRSCGRRRRPRRAPRPAPSRRRPRRRRAACRRAGSRRA